MSSYGYYRTIIFQYFSNIYKWLVLSQSANTHPIIDVLIQRAILKSGAKPAAPDVVLLVLLLLEIAEELELLLLMLAEEVIEVIEAVEESASDVCVWTDAASDDVDTETADEGRDTGPGPSLKEV